MRGFLHDAPSLDNFVGVPYREATVWSGLNVKELESKARLFLTLAGHDFAAFLVGGQPG